MSANTTTPIVPCSCCGDIYTSAWQRSPGHPDNGFWIFTCLNRNCDLYGQTFAESSVSWRPQVVLETILRTRGNSTEAQL